MPKVESIEDMESLAEAIVAARTSTAWETHGIILCHPSSPMHAEMLASGAKPMPDGMVLFSVVALDAIRDVVPGITPNPRKAHAVCMFGEKNMVFIFPNPRKEMN